MCDYCKPNQPTNIVSVNAPGFWLKMQVEYGKLLLAYDMKSAGQGMRIPLPVKFCPMCGEPLDKGDK